MSLPFLILILTLLLPIGAQLYLKSTFSTYSRIGVRRGLTGADVAGLILRDAEIAEVRDPSQYPNAAACGIEPVSGQLTDHYDPGSRMLRLSEPIYGGRSIAALGVAAHEVGHAIQHANHYAPLALRSAIYPVTSISSNLAWPLFIVGIFGQIPSLQLIAIALFGMAVVFSIITLPVEFDASRRALVALNNGGYLTQEELHGARKVLTAAALTYVAGTAVAILHLVRMILISRSSR